MRTIIVGALVALGWGVAGAASAQSGLVIDGTSTVRSWTCEATSFGIDTTPPTGFAEAVLRAEPALETVTLTFPVAAIECGNGKMNDHLRKALELKRHPEITYTLSRYDLARAEAGVAVKADGQLTIAGTTRPITMAVTVRRGADGVVRVKGAQVVKMTDFGVVPPKLMFGALTVGDEVTVKFDIPLRAEQVEVAVKDGRDLNEMER